MLPYTRYHKDFHHTCSMLLHYFVKVEKLPNLHVEGNNMFNQNLMRDLMIKFISHNVTYHKNIPLLILLKYVYNT